MGGRGVGQSDLYKDLSRGLSSIKYQFLMNKGEFYSVCYLIANKDLVKPELMNGWYYDVRVNSASGNREMGSGKKRGSKE